MLMAILFQNPGKYKILITLDISTIWALFLIHTVTYKGGDGGGGNDDVFCTLPFHIRTAHPLVISMRITRPKLSVVAARRLSGEIFILSPSLLLSGKPNLQAEKATWFYTELISKGFQ